MISAIEGPKTVANAGPAPLTLVEVMVLNHVPGLSVAVIKDFKIHWAKSWGLADVETQAAAREDTSERASRQFP